MSNKELDRLEEERFSVLLVASLGDDQAESLTSLDELGALCQNLGWICAERRVQKVRSITPQFYFGTGMAKELADLAEELEVQAIVFDLALSPTQQRNWEELSGKVVADRPAVIIDIFARRAQTKEAKVQIELAELEYRLPRLSSSYTEMSRQRGGAYGTRGAGEMKLELDRRVIRSRMSLLKQELGKIRRQREVLRKQRSDSACAAIIGYTNAGKSSLLRVLSDSDVYAEDAPFVTLDPLARKVKLPEGAEIVISDTVGFIRNLPHSLIESFMASFEEARFADFLIHVLDASDPELSIHVEVTRSVLREIGIEVPPAIFVLNKIDTVGEARRSELVLHYPDAITISCKTGAGLDDLRSAIVREMSRASKSLVFKIPYDRGDALSLLHREAQILESREEETGYVIRASLGAKTVGKMAKLGLEAQPAGLLTGNDS